MKFWKLVSVTIFLILSVDSYANWREEVVQEKPNSSAYSTSGHYPNAVFDINNQLHVTHDAQIYSVKNNSQWLSHELDLGYFLSPKLPVSFMSDGSKHFFYSSNNSFSRNSKHVQLYDAGITVVENFLPAAFKSDVPPLSLIDDNNFIHLVYLDISDWSINYATNKSGSWVVKKIYNISYSDKEKEVFQGKYEDFSYGLDFNIDSNKNITIAFVEWHYEHSAYYAYSAKLIKLFSSGSSWSSVVVTENTGSDLWKNPSIKIDYNMNVHMVYNFNHCSGFCYPSGIEYGTNKSGVWEVEKLSTDSYYFDDPDHAYLDPYWVTGLISDISINDNNDIFVTYVHGALDRSAVNVSSITSEIRTVKLDECMPVSFIAYDKLLVDHNVHILPVTGYIDGAINNQGLGAVAFHDKENDEPHILIEEHGLNVKSCMVSKNKFRIEIKNLKGVAVQLDDAITLPYIDGIYNITINNCINNVLAINASCFLEIEVSLPQNIDDLNNVDSTLYLGLQHINESKEESWYTIETSSLRPLDTNNTSGNNVASNSGGGSINLAFTINVFLLLAGYRLSRKYHNR